MTGDQLAMFVTIVAIVVVAWGSVFYLLPLNGRVRFQYHAAVLRDRGVDAVLDERLPPVASVREFIERADAMATDPAFFSLTRVLATHRALRETAWHGSSSSMRYGDLKPDHEELLEGLEGALNQVFARRLVFGSSFGWALWLLTRGRDDSSRGPDHAVHVPPPEHLATEDLRLSSRYPAGTRTKVA